MNRVLVICTGFVLTINPLSAQDTGWQRFRGADAAGLNTAEIPTTWNDEQNVVWKTALPGKGSSSPVVYGDRIFLTAYTGYGLDAADAGDRSQLRLHVVCLDRNSGKTLWISETEPAAEEQEVTNRVADHGYSSPTPCVDEKAVYASFGPSGVVAFSHDGEFLWRRSVGTGTAGFGAAASPIVFEDLVIMNASIEDDAIYGLDRVTGEVRWRTSEIIRAWTTPTIVTIADGTSELVINQKGRVLGLDPRTGSQLWSCDGIQDYVVPCVVADGATLYCSGGRTNRTLKIRAGGRGDVTATHLEWKVDRGANVTSPLLVNGHLFWAHDKSIALCVRASDGEEMFRERMPTRSRVYGSVVSDGQRLFLTTRDSGVLVLDASSEYRELALNKLGSEEELFNATPAIVGDTLLLRSDRYLYCIAKTN